MRYSTVDHEEQTATTEHQGASIWHGKHSGNQAASLWIVTVLKFKGTATSV